MNVDQLDNGKFFHGKIEGNVETRGWFIGSFLNESNNCRTDKLEVMFCDHNVGDVIEPHYHKEKVEVLIIIEGLAKYCVNGNEILLKTGDFLFVDVNNHISGEFVEKSKIIAIHSPSIPSDKFK